MRVSCGDALSGFFWFYTILASVYVTVGSVFVIVMILDMSEEDKKIYPSIILIFLYIVLIVSCIVTGCQLNKIYTWVINYAIMGFALFVVTAIISLRIKRLLDIGLALIIFVIGLVPCGITNAIINTSDYHFEGIYYSEEDSSLNVLNARVFSYDVATLIIPSKYDNGTVITWKAPFEQKSNEILNYVALPDTLINIDDKAFYDCRELKGVEIPETLEYIGNKAFACCSSLDSIYIPEMLKYIGNDAFENCSLLESIYIPSSVTMVGEYAFSGCDSLTIYCGLESEPVDRFGQSLWGYNWSGGRTVVWGYTVS